MSGKKDWKLLINLIMWEKILDQKTVIGTKINH